MIKAVYREQWITLSKIAVPLRACTAMTAEIAAASVLTEVIDLRFDTKNWENVYECTNKISRDNGTSAN